MTSEQKVRAKFPNVKFNLIPIPFFESLGYEIKVGDIILSSGWGDLNFAWDEAAKAIEKLKIQKQKP